MGSVLQRAARIAACVGALACAGCGGEDLESRTFELESCSVGMVTPVVHTANGLDRKQEFAGCRARWDVTTRVLTIHLIPPNTRGSFRNPAPGTLILSTFGGSSEWTTLLVDTPDGEALPTHVPIDQMQVRYVEPERGRVMRGNGRSTVAENQVGFRSPATREGAHITLQTNLENVRFQDGSFITGQVRVLAEGGDPQPVTPP